MKYTRFIKKRNYYTYIQKQILLKSMQVGVDSVASFITVNGQSK